MILGGLQKTSLIDYPGKVACVLFVSGCNFRCPYCHNPQLVQAEDAPAFLTEPWFFSFLEKRTGFLDGVVISGGEPTIHRDIASWCEKIKALGYPIKLDTNGSRPEMLKRLIADHRVDYIAMDIKSAPDGYAPHISNHDPSDSICQSIQLIIDSGIDHEFRTTCVKPFVTEDNFHVIARLVDGARRFVLQPFNDTGILNPMFFNNTTTYTDADLHRFQSIIAPHVGACVIRDGG